MFCFLLFLLNLPNSFFYPISSLIFTVLFLFLFYSILILRLLKFQSHRFFFLIRSVLISSYSFLFSVLFSFFCPISFFILTVLFPFFSIIFLFSVYLNFYICGFSVFDPLSLFCIILFSSHCPVLFFVSYFHSYFHY